jgi:hypothetical protein
LTVPSTATPSESVPVGAAGMDADLTVLDRDILAEGPTSIMGTTVALTVVGGEIVHASEDVG